MNRWEAGERVLLTLWVGGMWVLGYLVAPTLFSNLDSRRIAGEIAGQLFGYMGSVGLVCGGLLLTSMVMRLGRGWLRSWRPWVVLAMLAITLAGELVFLPQMKEIQGAAGVVLEPGSSMHERFSVLHGFASALFLINSLLGLVLVVFGTSRRACTV